MHSEELIRVINEQREEASDLMRDEGIISRETLDDSRKYLSTPFAFVITGIRRCGKSVYSHLLMKDKTYGYVNFDDERLMGLEPGDLNDVLEAVYGIYGKIDHVVLDEIQNIRGWELFVNRLSRTKRVIVTGSNANLLSTELGTHMTGRYVDFTLHPFSFREYLDHVKFEPDIYSTSSVARIKKHLRQYLLDGGIPDSYKFGKRFLRTLYQDILQRDVLSRYGVRYVKPFYEMVRNLISNYASEFSYNRLKKIYNIGSVSTVRNYVHYVENSFLLFEIPRFSYKLKQQELAPRKIYCMDTGIIHAVGFRSSGNMGKLMENLVAVELGRRASIHPSMEIFYWKDHQQREVDFIIKNDDRVTACLQVTYASERNDVSDRETRSLLRAANELNCKDISIITWDHEEFLDGIQYVPIWKWLLDPAGALFNAENEVQ